MTKETEEERRLRHQLDNSRQEKQALQGMLRKAADELDGLADADCDDAAKAEAATAASKLRRAASL